MAGTPKSNNQKELFVWGCKGMANIRPVKDIPLFFYNLTLSIRVFYLCCFSICIFALKNDPDLFIKKNFHLFFLFEFF